MCVFIGICVVVVCDPDSKVCRRSNCRSWEREKSFCLSAWALLPFMVGGLPPAFYPLRCTHTHKHTTSVASREGELTFIICRKLEFNSIFCLPLKHRTKLYFDLKDWSNMFHHNVFEVMQYCSPSASIITFQKWRFWNCNFTAYDQYTISSDPNNSNLSICWSAT